jgi:hypothetical protein
MPREAEASLVGMIFDVTRGQQNAGIHSSTSAAEFAVLRLHAG